MEIHATRTTLLQDRKMFPVDTHQRKIQNTSHCNDKLPTQYHLVFQRDIIHPSEKLS
jgi:hypothetical protein